MFLNYYFKCVVIGSQIEQPEVAHEDKESKIFPDSNVPSIITSHCLTTEFLIYSTNVSYRLFI